MTAQLHGFRCGVLVPGVQCALAPRAPGPEGVGWRAFCTSPAKTKVDSVQSRCNWLRRTA